MNDLENFQWLLYNNYDVKGNCCRHDDKEYVLFYQLEDQLDCWQKDKYCKNCFQYRIECLGCGGYYTNFRAFHNNVNISDNYNLTQYSLPTDSFLEFYFIDSIQVINFVLREKNFVTGYEKFVYNKMKKYYAKNKMDKINNIFSLCTELNDNIKNINYIKNNTAKQIDINNIKINYLIYL